MPARGNDPGYEARGGEEVREGWREGEEGEGGQGDERWQRWESRGRGGMQRVEGGMGVV